MEISPFVLAQTVLCAVGFPAHMPFAVDFLSPSAEYRVYHLLEKLISDELMSFAKSKMSLMSCPGRQLLCQEIKGETPSARRVIFLSKSDMAGVIGGHKATNPDERKLGAFMNQPRILLVELKMFIEAVYTVTHLRFMIKEADQHHTLNLTTKREMFQWIADHWENFHELFTQIAVTQKTTLSFAAN
jgi:hypothetical protein